MVKISKYLAYHLRHHPEKIGLKLDENGWVAVAELLAAAKKDRFRISLHELNEVVETNDKKRYAFDSTGQKIRANQGHSVTVDLQLEPRTPPDILYHGTGSKNVASINKNGLVKRSRHHVHLSSDLGTAQNVGKRRGFPVVFVVNSYAMHEAGFNFYCSENEVWLVEKVPPQYLQLY